MNNVLHHIRNMKHKKFSKKIGRGRMFPAASAQGGVG